MHENVPLDEYRQAITATVIVATMTIADSPSLIVLLRKKKYARLQADASKWSLKPKKGKGKGKGMPRDTAKPRRPKH